MRRGGAFLLLAVIAFGSCVRPSAPRIPAGEDYVFPAAAAGEVTPEEARRIASAWQKLLGGNAGAAAKSFEKLLARRPGLVPAETGLAYACLRAGRLDEAARRFDSALARRPDYVPALAGEGSVAVRRGDAEAAVGFYRRALSGAPGDAALRKRLAELKVQVTERRLAEAQAAIANGEPDRAVSAYRAALEAAPELTSVRTALAELLVSEGRSADAASALESDPTGDRQLLLLRGGILMGMQDYARARDAYERVLEQDPADVEAARGERAARESLNLLGMPEEYRRIPSAERLSRADLAALLTVKVTALARVQSREPRVAVDIAASWAREYIASVLALGVMDVYPNHTFQPAGIVRRAELARAVGRVLDLLGSPRAAAPVPTDMAPTHFDFEAVERALGAGLMELDAQGAFEPWRVVSGREAVGVVDGLARLAGS
ncbi:MAG: hypothetical protein A2V74_01515 [Acidobacteria bacterium RBG_16_70_10]|nr:MAG: hypothetical protein A2V74_01515 [Acidobacteria bacterium RBG_16_70_10]